MLTDIIGGYPARSSWIDAPSVNVSKTLSLPGKSSTEANAAHECLSKKALIRL